MLKNDKGCAVAFGGVLLAVTAIGALLLFRAHRLAADNIVSHLSLVGIPAAFAILLILYGLGKFDHWR